MVMTVKYLSEAEKQDSRHLWEEAFPEDSQAFDDYYYKEKVQENRILAIVEGTHSEYVTAAAVRRRPSVQHSGMSRVDAMIQLNPYWIHVGDWNWKVDYIVGVATRKEKRHRGYMSTLLSKMMTDMKNDQVPFCFLMPADPAIYRPFGFTYIFDQPKWELDETKAKALTRKHLIPESDSAEYAKLCKEAAAWMEDWLEERYQVYTVRDEAYLRRQVKEIASENGYLDVLYEEDQIVGLQSAWGWDEQEQRLLYADDKYVKSSETTAKSAIMARIISPEVLVKAVHLKDDAKRTERKLQLRLEDPLIEENNRIWAWTLSHTSSKLERIYEDVFAGPKAPKPEVDLTLTITELTEWLFGYRVPEQAAPYAEEIAVPGRVFLDEVV
jgi:hypothetical protein